MATSSTDPLADELSSRDDKSLDNMIEALKEIKKTKESKKD
jgi:hypothetical protein